MCKNELFRSLWTKNEPFKVQRRKTKLMHSLGTKTIFWPKCKGRGHEFIRKINDYYLPMSSRITPHQ